MTFHLYMVLLLSVFQVLKSQAYLPSRDPSGPFLMAVDHCFSIKGQGTVMTGTILTGSVSLGDNVEIPALKVSVSFPPFPSPSSTTERGMDGRLSIRKKHTLFSLICPFIS